MAAGMTLAGLLLALMITPPKVAATLPGDNGRIAFASNRTTGEGVNNSEGDFEIYAKGSNGEHQTYLTNHPAVDLTPDWQALQER
jgi:hypothetical protein